MFKIRKNVNRALFYLRYSDNNNKIEINIRLFQLVLTIQFEQIILKRLNRRKIKLCFISRVII